MLKIKSKILDKNMHSNWKEFSYLVLILFSFVLWGKIEGQEILKQKLTMHLSNGQEIEKETLSPGEISGLTVEHIILVGSNSISVKSDDKKATILIFIKGRGNLEVENSSYQIVPETIALPLKTPKVIVSAEKGDTLHFIKMLKELTDQDTKELNSYPEENRNKIYFTSFEDCEAYTEKIKSPNTVSRTILPKNYIPRVAMGTVKTKGPDAVGAHKHPMLDQLFLGLGGNKIEVIADEASTKLNEFEILHIPIGSNHSATVKENEMMYYIWMDFFLTKKGEDWLKTHKKMGKK